MRLFFVLVFSLGVRLAIAQDINFVKTYHFFVNKAELLAFDSNYKDAFANYQKALVAVPRGFIKDYFNATVCATYSGDATNTYKYLLEVADKGISLDFIKDESAFMGIQQDPNRRNFEKEYLAKKRGFDLNINKGLQDKLAKVVERDQWFRMRGAEAFAFKIVKVDHQNASELDYIYDKYGFPGKAHIGYGDGGMLIIQYPVYTVIRRQSL
jgi:hypothetical protein